MKQIQRNSKFLKYESSKYKGELISDIKLYSDAFYTLLELQEAGKVHGIQAVEIQCYIEFTTESGKSLNEIFLSVDGIDVISVDTICCNNTFENLELIK